MKPKATNPTYPWVVVELAGYTDERVTHEAETYDEAYVAMHELYTDFEREELDVDIMKRLSDGTLTTEY